MQARVHSPLRAVPLFGGWVLVSLVVVLGLSLTGLAQVEPNQPASPAPAVPAPGGVTLNSPPATGPYVAEAVGNDVYIRSGAGTNFYHCGKLYAGDRIQVIKSQDGWSCVVPPPGCFSWISMQYVSINLQNPTIGIVTGDNVGVYAGSDYVEPMHSTSKQVTLNRGQIVKLLGEEKDNYYKIAPPDGAYLWVSSQFVQATVAPAAKPAGIDVANVVKPAPGAPPKDPNKPAAPLTGLDLYYALNEQIKAERAKPTPEQNYTDIRQKLTELAASKDGSRAARYAEYTLKQVERYELACTVTKEVELQSKELQKTTSKIDEARAAKLAQVPAVSKFAITGKFENSSVYTVGGQAKRYRILDDSGKTICYVMPTGSAATTDLSKYVGHKVGLVGKISSHEATARAFIAFSDIALVE